MDTRAIVEELAGNFSRDSLVSFFRIASGKFRPEWEDLSIYVENAEFARDFHKIGSIEFEDGQRLVVLVGEITHELSSRSGKQKQYELAKKILKQHYYDAGIFVFHDHMGHFRFSLITAKYTGAKREFSTFRRYTYFVSPDGDRNRTFIDQLGTADFSSIENLLAAFSVEPVTKEFFRDYSRIFNEAEASIDHRWNADQKRLYTQRFFNRMMFITFLERKSWLKINGRTDYLRALFEDYRSEPLVKSANFHRTRLNTLFFQGLNNPRGNKLQTDPEYSVLQEKIGDVPYLNGGLFEQEVDDETFFFPDEVVKRILDDLLYRYNFTVSESTPLDVEVAVDPEMLGKIFEELVTGRHESGSYYTPKPIVAFMCRESLKEYLKSNLPEEEGEAIHVFVEYNEPSDLKNPEKVLTALRMVKVCDPACGSGAYLLGMMHELLEQRECLFAAHIADASKVYDRKLEIIQNNLYGVDIDPFAVNIARLRLWLSLIVDYEGMNPPPLPNLDFKIEIGDSLTGPDPSGGLQLDMFRQPQVKQFLDLKERFLKTHSGTKQKRLLAQEIQAVRSRISEWAHPNLSNFDPNGFDWQVEFAEVFAPQLEEPTLSGKMPGVFKSKNDQGKPIEAKNSGFDIVITNPPYIRQEQITNKIQLEKLFGKSSRFNVYNGRADLFVYFYARALQILRPFGVVVIISSDKLFSRGYAENLRKLLSKNLRIKSIIDFGEYPIFGATIETCILIGQMMDELRVSTEFLFRRITSETEIKNLHASVEEQGWQIPQNRLTKREWVFADRLGFETLEAISKNTIPLGEYVENEIFSGVKTGRNGVFVIDSSKKEELIKSDPKSSELIKKWLVGNDIENWGINWGGKFLIYPEPGINISKYPAIHAYLAKHKESLLSRATSDKHKWFELQQPQVGFYRRFEEPKIVYQNVSRYYKFALDVDGYYPDMNVLFIPRHDLFLLGLLGSSVIQFFAHKLTDTEPGGFLVMRTMYVKQFPIPLCDEDEKLAVIDIVKKLIDNNNNRIAKKKLKIELDEVVFHIFNLSSIHIKKIRDVIIHESI